MSLALAMALSALIGAPLHAQVRPQVATPPADSATGILAGVVKDESGAALPDAILTVDGTALRGRSAADGGFLIEAVPVGIRELSVSKPGYRDVHTQVRVPPDSAVILEITLASEAQALPGVIIAEPVRNRLGVWVVDEAGRAVPNAQVDLVGLRRQGVTDAAGRHSFADIATGTYLLQVRKSGYGVAQRSVQMVPQVEREFSFVLHARGDEILTAELAALVAAETDRRKSLAGARATIVGRAELERWGNASLLTALLGSSGAIALVEAGTSCVLLDGYEAMRGGSDAGAVAREVTTSRGPVTIEGTGTQGRQSTVFQPGGAATRQAPGASVVRSGSGGWLSFFRASEVEMVEIYPQGTDNSRTLCGRFPPSSGCSCPPEPSGVVVWLRR